ncbi:MAG: hypothetical protein WCI51_07150 [Lentisphaerota bacterium]
MKKVIFLLFILSCVVVSVFSDDLTVKGKVYKDYEITGCSLEGIEVSHSSGIITVAPEDWPGERQDEITKYKNQIEKLKTAQQNPVKVEKKAEPKVENKLPENAICLIFKVIGVENGALLGSVNAVEWSKKNNISTQEKTRAVSGFAQYGKVTKEIEKEYSRSSKGMQDYLSLGQFSKDIDESLKIVYVTGIDTSEYTDDQQVVIAGIRSGTHKYIAVNGAARTVPKFTAVKK